MQRLVQALLDRADDQAAHGRRVAKAHFGLGGMDVDVDLARLAFDEQSRDRMAVGGQEIEIGARAARRRAVLSRTAPPVDEQELLARRSAG